MDTDQLLAHGRARFEHATAKRVLKEKYQAKMTFAHAGGLWRAGPELQCVLLTLAPATAAVLVDLYDTPIQINPVELMALSQQRWQEQLTAWLIEHEQLNQLR